MELLGSVGRGVKRCRELGCRSSAKEGQVGSRDLDACEEGLKACRPALGRLVRKGRDMDRAFLGLEGKAKRVEVAVEDVKEGGSDARRALDDPIINILLMLDVCNLRSNAGSAMTRSLTWARSRQKRGSLRGYPA